MRGATDWIPTQNPLIIAKLRSYLGLVVANKVAWGIPDTAIQPLLDLQAEIEPLWDKISDKRRRTPSDVTAFNDCKKRLLAEWRAFHRENVRGNRKISPADLAALVGKEYDPEPSPHPPIDDIPLVGARAQGGGDLEFRIRVTEDTKMASMHPAANLIEFRFTILEPGDIPPSDENDYPKKEVSSRAKFTLALGLKNTGKKFFGIFRWVNTHKPRTAGHWTEPISVIIA